MITRMVTIFCLTVCLLEAAGLSYGIAFAQAAAVSQSSPLQSRRYDTDGPTEEQKRLAPLRAGFIVNFANFTTWPREAFKDDEAPLVITIVNDRELARQIATLTADNRIHGRRVLVYYQAFPEDDDSQAVQKFADQLRQSHVVYLSIYLPMSRIHTALDMIDNRPTLTVSSKPAFAENGGMMGLVVRERRLAFDANVDAISDADLKVSSKVLRLARIVRGSRKRGED